MSSGAACMATRRWLFIVPMRRGKSATGRLSRVPTQRAELNLHVMKAPRKQGVASLCSSIPRDPLSPPAPEAARVINRSRFPGSAHCCFLALAVCGCAVSLPNWPLAWCFVLSTEHNTQGPSLCSRSRPGRRLCLSALLRVFIVPWAISFSRRHRAFLQARLLMSPAHPPHSSAAALALRALVFFAACSFATYCSSISIQ